MSWSVEVTTETCRRCEGEGVILTEVSGGRFDPRAEQWYPHEAVVMCSACDGMGYVEIDEEGDDDA